MSKVICTCLSLQRFTCSNYKGSGEQEQTSYKSVVLYFYSSIVVMHCDKQELVDCFANDLENNA